jgi:hypothetical protein
VFLIRHSLCFKNVAARHARQAHARLPNGAQGVLPPVSNPTQSATNLILGVTLMGEVCIAAHIICAKATHRHAFCEVPGFAGARDGNRHKADCRVALGITLRCTIGTPLAVTQIRLHPTPSGVWRLREKLAVGCGNNVAAFDVTTKNSKWREFS